MKLTVSPEGPIERLVVPAGATIKLDIGGSHGFMAVELCRRYPAGAAAVTATKQR